MAKESQLCSQCLTLNIEQLHHGFPMSTSTELSVRQENCDLCRLIWKTSYFPLERDSLDPVSVRLHTVNNDRNSSSGGETDNNTTLNSGHESNGHVSTTMPPQTLLTSEVDVGGGSWVKRAEFRVFSIEGTLAAAVVPGRPILAPNSKSNMNRIRGWLAHCMEKHPKCRRTLSSTTVDNDETMPLPSRVLDVGTEKTPQLRLLISSGQQRRRARYAALSYCWGTHANSVTRTLTSNIAAFTQTVDATSLPRTIADAVLVTRQLGLQYLWVDSFCIVQDDNEDWQRESRNMGQIFQNATCTIAATSAVHCGEGLFMKRVVDDENAEAPHKRGDFVQIPWVAGNERATGVYIAAMPTSDGSGLDFDHEINDSQWNKRGWVVQERILSRRIIHFAKTQLYWECQEALYSESNSKPLVLECRLQSKPAIFDRFTKETTPLTRWTVTNRNLQTASAVLALLKNKLRNEFGINTDFAPATMHRFWERVVDYYNTCQLSVEGDKLPAIEGLACEVSRLTGQTFCAGLWLEDIARGLYWSTKKEAGSSGYLRRQDLSEAPSWSWAGWAGPISMGNFVAEYDTGRPWVSPRSHEAIRAGSYRWCNAITPRSYSSCKTTTAVSSARIELFAHSWPAINAQHVTRSSHSSISDWRTDGWWKFGPYRIPIDKQLQGLDRIDIEVQPHGDEQDAFGGYVVLDDHTKIPEEMTCVVLNTETVVNVVSGVKGYGYYMLVTEQLEQTMEYRRIGIGVAVSETDHIPHGSLGRLSPQSSIVLV